MAQLLAGTHERRPSNSPAPVNGTTPRKRSGPAASTTVAGASGNLLTCIHQARLRASFSAPATARTTNRRKSSRWTSSRRSTRTRASAVHHSLSGRPDPYRDGLLNREEFAKSLGFLGETSEKKSAQQTNFFSLANFMFDVRLRLADL